MPRSRSPLSRSASHVRCPWSGVEPPGDADEGPRCSGRARALGVMLPERSDVVVDERRDVSMRARRVPVSVLGSRASVEAAVPGGCGCGCGCGGRKDGAEVFSGYRMRVMCESEGRRRGAGADEERSDDVVAAMGGAQGAQGDLGLALPCNAGANGD